MLIEDDRKVVGEDVAMALVKYQYRPKAEDKTHRYMAHVCVSVARRSMRIVHDQNTALDFVAFAKMAGIEIK